MRNRTKRIICKLMVAAILIGLTAGLSLPGFNARLRTGDRPVAPTAALPALQHEPSTIARGFEYQAVGQPDGYVDSPESLYGFPPDTANHAGQETALDEPEISGTSQTSAELVQEITTRSDSKAELFTRVRSLGLRHPDSRIREQALTHLAELGNDLAINSVIEALIDPEPRIRQVALEALYRLGNRVPIQPLVELAARSGNATLQAQVVAFIEQFADRASISLTDGFQK